MVGVIEVFPLGTDWPLEVLWGSTLGTVFIVVGFMLGIGLGSRSLSIGALGGYLVFVWFAIALDVELLTMIFYASMILIILGFSFKLWNTEGLKGGGR